MSFADGTWESPEDTSPTNVYRMARGVAPDAHGYRRKSQALERLLRRAGGDWTNIDLVD